MDTTSTREPGPAPEARTDPYTLPVLKDVSSGAIVIDVSDATAPVDWEMRADLLSPLSICYGGHSEDVCPILGRVNGDQSRAPHGLALELDLDDEAHRLFLSRYQRVLRAGVVVSAVVRRGQARRHSDALGGEAIRTLEVDPD